MYNQVKYFLKGLSIKLVEYALKSRKFRNLFQSTEYFITIERLTPILHLLSGCTEPLKSQIAAIVHLSHAQYAQDLFVLYALDMKKNGFFVEFGATDGLELSNTYLLEKNFSWSGILAEPAKVWHSKLVKNRKAAVEKKCVYSESGLKLSFSESQIHATLSGIMIHLDSNTSTIRDYEVDTISLGDLLRKYNAPSHIDYLSIDTEGSELKILKDFDFSEYTFGVITVEHNFRDDRFEVRDLMLKNGYFLVFEEICEIEYWFVNKQVSEKFLPLLN